ncbi:PA0613 family protein [Pseudomonas sp. S2_H08]
MIKEIDSLLRLWAQELHSEHSKGGLAGGNMVAMMMESNGQLIRGRRAFRAPLESSLDIELIVTKHLAPELVKVVREHYCTLDVDMRLRYAHCGCGRDTYYQRLHDAHLHIFGVMMGLAA